MTITNLELKGKPNNMTKQAFHLLIPAAGNARRMGQDMPKQYLKINGKPVLRYTLEKLININGLQSIVIAINGDHKELYQEAVQGLENVSFVIGSSSRKQSVYNGLKEFSNNNKSDIILIHDAARPLVQEKDVTALLKAMENAEAATLACPISDTLYRSEKSKDEILSRDNLWAIQTPQAFKLDTLMEAHEKFKDDDGFTDDAGLIRAMGHEVQIVPASRMNIKITTPEDFEMVQTMLNTAKQTRSASGYDVHAFEAAPSERRLMLGGIVIDHPVALKGHSDADVVLHAITDAILGIINEGDIGTHFPPSDPQWKDADSAIFLKEAAKLLATKGGDLSFIDVTIMAEEPKVGPHRTAMQTRIADILGVSTSMISIKATTTEGLGFTGRKEGIACQALATATLPVTN